ncbi:MAG: magnesium transporter [Candidatus Hydrogenedentes bacterium]|nr:magnesium transporter [Candidatus Hydrogenedentota bacterium]
MPTETARNTWAELQELVQRGDAEALRQYLRELPPGEIARAISRLNGTDRSGLLTLLEPGEAADLIEQLSDTQAADLMEELSVSQAAAIVGEMVSDRKADILGELGKREAEAILTAMDPEGAKRARQLLSYAPDTAGGLMITEFLAFSDKLNVGDVLHDLHENAERYSDYAIQYTYVVSDFGALVGVVPLRDLVLSTNVTPLTSIMIKEPLKVRFDTRLDELEQLFDRYTFLGIPVTDLEGQLIGVVQRAHVEKAVSERADRTFLRFSGIIGGDEFRSMPLRTRSFRRLSWLSLNILLNLISASVVAIYQDTLVAVIALAPFLPIISDMSGCSGNQAVAVSIRELTLGLIRPRDLARVFFKEVQVGILNGIALGLLICGVALLWKGNPYLGIVVGVALCLNTLLSVCLGGLIPMMLRLVRMDPALAAAPMLTTCTDMCGFFFVLSLATVWLPELTTG